MVIPALINPYDILTQYPTTRKSSVRIYGPTLQITQNVTHAENPKILLYPVIAVIPQHSPVIPQLGV